MRRLRLSGSPMLDFASRIEKVRAQAVARIAALGVGSNALIAAGFVLGIAAMPLVATGHSWIALPVLLLGVALAAIGRTGAGERSRPLSAALDLIVFASLPFAFALADPGRALAACFVLFAMIAAGAASLLAASNRGLARVDRVICLSAFAFACVFPPWFGLVAYMLGIFCFAAAGARIALALTRGAA